MKHKLEKVNEWENTYECLEEVVGLIDKKEAYQIVFDDLCRCSIFNGEYDAKNGSEDYMSGVYTVMEVIATNVSDECYYSFQKTFWDNINKSKRKAGISSDRYAKLNIKK